MKRYNLLIPLPGHRSARPMPDYVVVDPASNLAAYLIGPGVAEFERTASRVGYVRVRVEGRLRVWRLSAPVKGRPPPG